MLFSNLTELSVRDVLPRVTPGHYHRLWLVPSVAGWLQVLKNIPTLRFLTLINSISHISGSEPEHADPLPVVDLPHLTLLTINTRICSCISLIDHLNIPPSCGIEFWLSPTIGRSSVVLDSPKPMLFFLSKQFTHWPQNCSDRYLKAEILNGGKIHFGNSKSVGEDSSRYMTKSDKVEAHSRYSKDPMLSLVLTLNPFDDSFAFYNQLLELYSPTFSTTTTLDLWIAQEFANSVITTTTTSGSFPALATFPSFTNLKTLNLLGQSPRYLLPLFHHSSLPGHDVLFPALESLHLTETNMEGLRSEFVAFLRRRAKAGIPLSEIKMLGGFVSNQTAERLSRFGNLRVSLPVDLLFYSHGEALEC